MRADQLFRNPRDEVNSPDLWTRRMALAAIVKAPNPQDREIFEDLLSDDDPSTALLAFLGLKKLYPAPVPVKNAWKELFGESIDLLVRRACSGPVQLRVAALKALAFSPENLSYGLIERVLQSLDEPVSYENISTGESPSLPLVQPPQKFFLPEGFSLILASLPGGQERVRLLQRELYSSDSARLVPVLLALQIHPVPELTDQILLLVRSSDKRVACEAARALLACGGKRVFLMIISLLKETSDIERKSWLLPLVARTGKDEIWNILEHHANHENELLRYSALTAIDIYPAPIEKKAKVFTKLVDDSDARVACYAAQLAWHSGSMKALRFLENGLNSETKSLRKHAAKAFSGIGAETSVPILSSRLDIERTGDVIRQIILSLRKLIPGYKRKFGVIDLLIPRFARLLKSTDAFRRNQTAVLCGITGKPAEDIVLKSLEKEHHPHVIASLLNSLGKIGTDRLLVFSKFHDHPDPRVRSNMISSMLICGPKAVSYFTEALSDPSPRVRSAAAKNMFLLGQLDIIPVLNRMLLVPSPVSVLSACYSLGQLMRIQPPILNPDHPVPLALSRKLKIMRRNQNSGPMLLNSPELTDVFREMSIAGGNIKKLLWILEEKNRRFPASHAIRRMLAAVCTTDGQYDKAMSLLEQCLSEQPTILSDLMDAYRLALKTGNLEKANSYGNKTKEIYKVLLDSCMALCRNIRGSGAEFMIERLHHLSEPSMNLYNAMIQLKVIEGDKETVIDLLSELALSRPTNYFVIRKLSSVLPESMSELKAALQNYSGTN